MGGAKTKDALLDEVRELRHQVAALTGRVEELEAAPPTSHQTHFEERRGTFGPSIKRSKATSHSKAVNRALEMIGVLPQTEPEVDEEKRAADRASHARAIERMRSLKFIDDEPASGSPAPVPLPELTEGGTAEHEDGGSSEAAPVDIGAAISIDLTRRAWGTRLVALRLLAVEALLLAGIFWLLPGASGVFVALLGVAALAAPAWGMHAPTLRGHARFFTLVLLARCLFPDMLEQVRETAWPNPAALAMIASCVPGMIVMIVGSQGWALVATLMSVVLATAAGTVAQSIQVAMGVGVATAFGCIFMHRWARA